MKYENGLEIDISRCLKALLSKWWLIILLAVVGGAIGYVMTMNYSANIYGAKSTVYSASMGSYKDSQVGISAMNNYADIATSMKVCERAAQLIGNEHITASTIKSSTMVTANTVSVSQYVKSDSSILNITSYAADPNMAMKMSEAVAESFVAEMCSILGNRDVQILDKPYESFLENDANKERWKIRIIALFIGAIVAIVGILFSEIFNKKAETIRECTLKGKVPVIGMIPKYKN